MNITHLTYDYDVYYHDEKLDNILDIEYDSMSRNFLGDSCVNITIIYIDDTIREIKTTSNYVKFVKRNERFKPCLAKEDE